MIEECLLQLLDVMSQAQLARHLGTTRHHVNMWVRGLHRPGPVYVERILNLHARVFSAA